MPIIRKHHWLVTIILIFILLLLCNKNSSTQVEETIAADSYEPDSIPEDGTIISKDSTQKHSLTEEDADWFRCSLSSHDTLLLISSGTVPTIITLYDRNTTTILDVAEPKETATKLLYSITASGTYFIKVTAEHGSHTGTYELSMKTGSDNGLVTADEYEDDNTKESARQNCMPTDSFIQKRTLTYLGAEADTDWVAFPATAAKKYTIKAITSPTTILSVSLFNSTSNRYIQQITTSAMSITYTPSTSDTLYLKIHRSTSVVGIAYTLSVQGYFINDSFESDSSRTVAKTFSRSSESRILIPSDTDWVKYTAEPQDSVIAMTTGTADMKLALFSSSGSTPLKECDATDGTIRNALISWKSASGGQFYIRITGQTASSSGFYTLQIFSLKKGTLIFHDSLESDNTKAEAHLVSDPVLSSEVHSLHINDTDWIAFPVIAGGEYTVQITKSTQSFDIYGYTSGDSLFGSKIDLKSPSIVYSSQKDDTLYYRISSSTAVGWYTLSVSRTDPVPDQYETDNTKAQARFITDSMMTVEIHSLTVQDTDWIAVPIYANGKYTVDVRNDDVAFDMYLYSSADSLIQSLTNSTNHTISVMPESNDTFYFRLTSSDEVKEYTLTVSRADPVFPDVYEEDNSRGSAKPIVFNSPQSHTLELNDSDWVAIPVEPDSTYTITTSASFLYYLEIIADTVLYVKCDSTHTITLTPTNTETMYVLVRQLYITSVYTGFYTLVVRDKTFLPTRAVVPGGMDFSYR